MTSTARFHSIAAALSAATILVAPQHAIAREER